MILKWNKPCLKVVEFVPSQNFSPERSHVTLLPGVNEVTDKEYEAMKAHIKPELERKDIEVVEVKTLTAPGKPQRMASSIAEMPVKVAAKLVSECESGETLNLWLAKEGREEIRIRIKKQLEKLGLDEVEVDLEIADEAEKAAAGKKEKEEDK